MEDILDMFHLVCVSPPPTFHCSNLPSNTRQTSSSPLPDLFPMHRIATDYLIPPGLSLTLRLRRLYVSLWDRRAHLFSDMHEH